MINDIISTNAVLYRAQIEDYNMKLNKLNTIWFKLDVVNHKNRINIIYMKNGIVVGAAFLQITYNRFKLYSLFVLPEYRWHWIAECILKYIYHTYHTVYFFVAQDNHKAIELYDRIWCKRLDMSSNKYPHSYEYKVYAYKLHINRMRNT